ncbi:MAG: hypothetical protein WEF50_17600 [Myxococcota bacterium]
MTLKSVIARLVPAFAGAFLALLPAAEAAAHGSKGKFVVEEATIAEIQKAILSRKITTKELVYRYLERIKAYNGTCVNEPRASSARSRPFPTPAS